MSENPHGWVESTLGDVAIISDARRIPLNARERAMRPGPYPYYGANGQAGTIDDYLFEGDHILLAEDGGYFDNPNRPNAYPVTGRFWVNNHAHILRTTERASLPFLLYLLNATDLMPYVSGTTRLKLTQADMRRIPLLLPPLPEQSRIVARVETLFARTRRARADLERIAPLAARYEPGLLAATMVGALAGDGRRGSGPTAHESLGTVRLRRVSVSRLGKRRKCSGVPDLALPTGWAWISPDEIATDEPYSIGIGPFGSNLTVKDYRHSGVPLIFVRDVRQGHFGREASRYIAPDHAAALRAHAIYGGEVLITKMGDPPGETAVYPRNAGLAVITADCIKLKPCSELATPEFVALAIRAPYFARQIDSATRGVAQQKVSLDRFRTLAIAVAPITIQDAIVSAVSAQLRSSSTIVHEAARTHALLDRLERSVLARAFRGELVPQDASERNDSLPSPATFAPSQPGRDHRRTRAHGARAAARLGNP